MPRATWNETLLAHAPADDVRRVEGNVYFPPDAVRTEHLRPSDHRTACPWKGTAHYYHVVADGEINENAAWYYPDPKEAAREITGHIAFWRGVRVEE